ncbi:MAG: preprotein translocase subunit SecG [Bacteroidetes bacterium]|nr:preprotein translocase subunit SecG [Bacteroidales bacterium]NJO70392.1 preprotein translocase subunit SecG [Bacteroidota bacterium]
MVLFAIVIFIVCVLLILIVLVQNSKGGGLAAGFSSSNQIMGVRRTSDFLEKATWTLAGILLFICLAASIVIPKVSRQERKSAIEQKINTQDPAAVPAFPSQQQAQPQSKPATSTDDAKKTDSI